MLHSSLSFILVKHPAIQGLTFLLQNQFFLIIEKPLHKTAPAQLFNFLIHIFKVITDSIYTPSCTAQCGIDLSYQRLQSPDRSQLVYSNIYEHFPPPLGNLLPKLLSVIIPQDETVRGFLDAIVDLAPCIKIFLNVDVISLFLFSFSNFLRNNQL